jgi:hypothetical protein
MYVIINKTNVLLPQPEVTVAILFIPFGFIAPKTSNYLPFQSFDSEHHLMKVILSVT